MPDDLEDEEQSVRERIEGYRRVAEEERQRIQRVWMSFSNVLPRGRITSLEQAERNLEVMAAGLDRMGRDLLRTPLHPWERILPGRSRINGPLTAPAVPPEPKPVTPPEPPKSLWERLEDAEDSEPVVAPAAPAPVNAGLARRRLWRLACVAMAVLLSLVGWVLWRL